MKVPPIKILKKSEEFERADKTTFKTKMACSAEEGLLGHISSRLGSEVLQVKGLVQPGLFTYDLAKLNLNCHNELFVIMCNRNRGDGVNAISPSL